MIYISHRGNIEGRSICDENSPKYVLDTIHKGYDCEIDVWYFDARWYLGHDSPQYKISENFLCNQHLWCHAKNIQALNMLKHIDIHVFWHDKDDYVLTSKGYILALPMKHNENTICMMPEINNLQKEDIKHCVGVCSDFIGDLL